MFNFPSPDLQISFSGMLAQLRGELLQDALSVTVKELDVIEIDKALAQFVPKQSLAALASHGLRGELMFPVPIVLTENPRLLGYYRLLYGYSQKEFYTRTTGASRLQSMEKKGKLTPANEECLPDVCREFAQAGAVLLEGIGERRISQALLDDLTLLTLGPQLRGGVNVKKGADGIVKVFDAIHDIVRPAVTNSNPDHIELRNAAGRRVLIEFASDPDIVIKEEMGEENYRELIAVEVKAGSDFSNIHNRIGEAEKSHQKAKAEGFAECWTVVNVDRIDIEMAKTESPTTKRFYRISDLTRADGPDYLDFRARVIGLTGIPSD